MINTYFLCSYLKYKLQQYNCDFPKFHSKFNIPIIILSMVVSGIK